MWRKRETNPTNNDRSAVNPDFSVSRERCAIGIYVLDKSRVILMESGDSSTRQVLKYSGDLNHIPSPGEQPIMWDWELYSTSDWRAHIKEFKTLRSLAVTYGDLQVTTAEFEKFKAVLDSSITTKGNPFDASIRAAAAAIGKTMPHFDDTSDAFMDGCPACTIC